MSPSPAAQDQPPSHDACAAAILDALPSVTWFLRQRVSARPGAGGLSITQLRALAVLRRFPAATLSVVCEHLGSALPTVSRLVATLVKKGLVARRVARDDRRQVALELTARGNAALDAAAGEARGVVAAKLSHLNPDQRAAMLASMNLLSEIFKAGGEA